MKNDTDSFDGPALVKGETEVTPEMVKEGALLVMQFDPRWDSGADLAAEIYRAMETVRTRAAE